MISREQILQRFVEWYPETLLQLRRWREESDGWRLPAKTGRSRKHPLLRDLLMEIARGEKLAIGLYFFLGDLCSLSQLKDVWSRFAREDSSHFFRAGMGLLRLGADTNLGIPKLSYSACRCDSVNGLVFTLNLAICCKLDLVESYERCVAAGAGKEFAEVLCRENLHLQVLAESFLPRSRAGLSFPGKETPWRLNLDSVEV